MFTHEKFKAYQESIEFIKVALELIEELPPGYSSLKDQLRRAAFSVALNIVEGTGKYSQPDRSRFYSIARGSAMECAAICDIIGLLNHRLEKRTSRGKLKLKSIVSILSAVCRN